MKSKMSFELNRLIRDNIRALTPYSSARDEYAGPATNAIFLDANEQPLPLPGAPRAINRYPRSSQQAFLDTLSVIKGVARECIIPGNGSDELIDFVMTCFARPGKDEVLVFPPTFGMYAVRARVHDLEVISVPLDKTFLLRAGAALHAATEHTRIMFVCHPNNPTGNIQQKEAIRQLLGSFHGLVVVDEAYIDFCPEESLLPELGEHPNLIILQSFSKAWAMAGARVGAAFASPEIISVMNKVRPPYNQSMPSLQAATEALNRYADFRAVIRQTINRREALARELSSMPLVVKVFPSQANFLLVKTRHADNIYQSLASAGIVVRNRHREPGCSGCLRITVGTDGENQALLRAWRQLDELGMAVLPLAPHGGESPYGFVPDQAHEGAASDRRVGLSRETAETRVLLNLNLDGTGEAAIDTGLGMLDHLLQQLARHGRFDLELLTRGDLHIDPHHAVEDTAIVLGQAFRKALGNKAGISRFGFALPMDDSQARVLLDLGGRVYFKWEPKMPRGTTGSIPNSLFPHFFRSFAEAAACNVHIEASGEDEHHLVEAVFKAFARALRMAAERLPGDQRIPSTKEMI